MEMNKYLIAALYVVAGCVATLPINVRGGNVSVRTDCYRLLVSSTEKVITVSTEKRSTEDFDYGDFYNQSHAETVDARKSLYYLLVCRSTGLESPGNCSKSHPGSRENGMISDL